MTSTRRWAIVGLLCTAMMATYFERVNLSVALATAEFKSRAGLA